MREKRGESREGGKRDFKRILTPIDIIVSNLSTLTDRLTSPPAFYPLHTLKVM